jgi:transposase
VTTSLNADGNRDGNARGRTGTCTDAGTLPHHNGTTEGVSTKTKLLKRQMHGRAGFTLLRHRILLG